MANHSVSLDCGDNMPPLPAAVPDRTPPPAHPCTTSRQGKHTEFNPLYQLSDNMFATKIVVLVFQGYFLKGELICDPVQRRRRLLMASHSVSLDCGDNLPA